MKINSKPHITSFIFLILFLTTFVYLTVVMGQKNKLEDNLKDELLDSELLLSEKLLEQKENAALKIDFLHLERETVYVKNRSDSLFTLLSEKENELKKAQVGIFQKTINKQHNIIESLYKKLFEDSVQTIRKVYELDSVNQTLEKDLIGNMVERQNFVDEIERLSMLKINDALVEALNRKKNLTTKATKAKQLKAIIQVSDQAHDLNFKIIDPKGNEMPLTSMNFLVEIKNPDPATENHAFFISPEIQINTLKNLQQLELTYQCGAKLSPGLYWIMVFNGKDLIGNLRARLQ